MLIVSSPTLGTQIEFYRKQDAEGWSESQKLHPKRKHRLFHSYIKRLSEPSAFRRVGRAPWSRHTSVRQNKVYSYERSGLAGYAIGDQEDDFCIRISGLSYYIYAGI